MNTDTKTQTAETELKQPKVTHCTVLQDNLLEALKIVAPFAAKKSTLPILTHADLVVEGGRLAVSATNLEQYAKVYIGAQLPDEDFALAMPIKAFSDVIGMLNGQVSLTVKHKVCTMIVSSQILTDKKAKKGIKQENTMRGIDAAEFPVLPRCDTVIGTMGGADLKRVIERCLFAAATDESRPVLTTLCFIVKDGLITVVAADGFRLSVDTIRTHTETNGTYLIPAALFKDLYRHIEDDAEIVMRAAMKEVKHKSKDQAVETTTIEPNTVEFEVGPIVMGSQVVDGKYPDYTQIVPKSTPILATVNRKEMLAALKAALVFLKKSDYKGGMFSIRANQPNIMLVESHDAELGDARCEVEVSPFVGYNMRMAFNMTYLTDALNACHDDLVTIGFQPLAVKQIDPPLKIVEGNFIHVVMPMRGDGIGTTYAHTEQPDYADMSDDELRQVTGRFSIDDGPEGEYTVLADAIKACQEKAETEHIESHIFDNDRQVGVWEYDGRLPEEEHA